MSNSITFVTAMIQISAMEEGTTFYASDIGAKGGTMSGLRSHGYIEATGRTKDVIVPIEMWNGDILMKKSGVMEWRVTPNNEKPHWRANYHKRVFEAYSKCILQAAEALKTLGY